jgi:beta propeller repeat protein
VVWAESGPTWTIRGRRLSGGPISTFASGAANFLHPRISGDRVVFEQHGPSAPGGDVFAYEISTTASYPVATGPLPENQPDIDGTRVVYIRFRSQDLNGDGDVFLYDFGTGLTTQLTTTPALRRRPRISGNTVVWYEGPNGDWDVRGYDLVSGTDLPLVVGPSSAGIPDVDGHDVVFSDDRNGDWDIYRLTLNRAPEASAGPDQEVAATSPQGALVTLDGSASSDPDGDPLTFTWTGPFGILSGAVVSAPVPVGTSEITLTVADAWGGSASDTLTVAVRATASCPEVYVETFDPHGAHADPAGWVDFGLDDHGPVEAEGFRTSRFGRRIVYEARRACRASEYRSPEALAWRDYEWSGWYRPAHGKKGGDGFFVYSDLLAERFYLLGFPSHSHGHEGYRLVKSGGGRLEGRVRSGFVPRGGAWHRFRVQVVNEPDATRIRARFWKAGRREPSKWMIDARDPVDPLRSGAIGVLALARGARYEDFRVQALSGPASGISGDRDGDGICDGEDRYPDEAGALAPRRQGRHDPGERQDDDVDDEDARAETHGTSSSRCRWGSTFLRCPSGHFR